MRALLLDLAGLTLEDHSKIRANVASFLSIPVGEHENRRLREIAPLQLIDSVALLGTLCSALGAYFQWRQVSLAKIEQNERKLEHIFDQVELRFNTRINLALRATVKKALDSNKQPISFDILSDRELYRITLFEADKVLLIKGRRLKS